jgi:hypothetical protein
MLTRGGSSASAPVLALEGVVAIVHKRDERRTWPPECQRQAERDDRRTAAMGVIAPSWRGAGALPGLGVRSCLARRGHEQVKRATLLPHPAMVVEGQAYARENLDNVVDGA